MSLANSGGIRSDAVIPAGDYTELQSFESLPFGKFVAVVEDVDAANLKLLLENAVSAITLDAAGEPAATGSGTGRFAQVGGLSFTYDPDGEALTFDADGNVVNPGDRIVDLFLADGTQLIADGAILDDAFEVDVVTNSFSVGGGDQYPFPTGRTTLLGETGQEALASYITGTLQGVIGSGLYGGDGGRIGVVPEPGTALAALGLGGLTLLRRQRNA